MTISAQTSVTNTYTATAPAGETVVWVQWQLVDEIVALQPDGTPVAAGIVASGNVTDVTSPGDYDAWLYVDQPVTTLPSNFFVPQQASFPASAARKLVQPALPRPAPAR